MTRRYVLAPEAALDLVQIWRHIKQQSSVEIADRVESVIRDRIVFLAKNPSAGHWRKNLTDRQVKFLPVYSYLIVYHRHEAVAGTSRFFTVAETLSKSLRIAG